MPDDVSISVNGKVYAGWTSVTVTSAMDAASGAFSLSYTERWPGSSELWPIMKGDACVVKINGLQLITGFVDLVSPEFDGRGHGLNVQGRDTTGDLVDCSADHRPDQWFNLTTLALAKILCDPFKIPVSTDIDIGGPLPFPVKLQQGESVVDALSRYCSYKKQLIVPDGLGGLLITRAGLKRSDVALVQGANILAGSGTLDDSGRYSLYRVKAQAPYNPDLDPELESHIEAEASDDEIKRYRPLIVVAEMESTQATAKDRAEWEKSVRIGRGTQAEITVNGWQQKPGGDLWRPNTLASVKSTSLKIDGDMLIRAVTFSKNLRAGTTSRLSIVSPLAYTVRTPKIVNANPWMATLAEARK